MPLTNGQTFAGYTIIRLLGSGGMGEVYLAQHPRLPRRDALKLLPHDWSADTEYRARFNREADLASTLWHPHIVGVHDRGEEEGQLWISMDLVDGLDAARLLANRYPAGMPVEEVARIVTAVASALDYAHKQGLLHRDVKPANIMLTHVDDGGEQRILLTDFGIARNVDDISGLTKTNMTVGTVAYCAPEQLLGEDIDGRADQYSLAATAYHLLTGSQSFPNSNPAVVISRHLNVPPPALADSRPDLATLDPVLAIGLAKRPEDRFKRCSDFARALNEQIDSAGAPITSAPTASARRASPTVDAAPPHDDIVDPRKLWKHPWVAVAALITVAILIALVMVWRPWYRNSNSPQPNASPSAIPTTPIPRSNGPGTAVLPPFNPPAALGEHCTYSATAEAGVKQVSPPRSGRVPTDPAEVSATMVTNQGSIGIQLNNRMAPCTVNNFASLAQKGFFDNTPCHRLTSSPTLSVLQCGDPTGQGTGGQGYQFANEYPTNQYAPNDPALQHPVLYPRGTVAMANAGPGTNGSQFFLVYKNSELPPEYTVFGSINNTGLATLDKIAAAGVADGGEDGSPATPVTIKSIRLD
jgi:serine/threonine protein kinase